MDMNPCTNSGTRWVVVDQNCSACPKPAVWSANGNYRCVLDGSGKNTGYQERQETDTETCSATYGQTRWVSNGYNPSACPLPSGCASPCAGPEYKCINSNCEQGVRVCTDSYWDNSIGMFLNTYHYEFSDGSWSATLYEYSWCDCWFFTCA